MDSISLLIAVFFVMTCVGKIVNIVRMNRQVKTVDDKIKLARKPQIRWFILIFSVVMIGYGAYNLVKLGRNIPILKVMSEDNTLTEFYEKQSGKTPAEAAEMLKKAEKLRLGNIEMIALYVLLLVSEAFSMIFGRYLFLSKAGIYSDGAFFKADDYVYRFTETPKGRRLELLRNGTVKPEELSVIGDEERLISTLADNYKPYQ